MYIVPIYIYPVSWCGHLSWHTLNFSLWPSFSFHLMFQPWLCICLGLSNMSFFTTLNLKAFLFHTFRKHQKFFISILYPQSLHSWTPMIWRVNRMRTLTSKFFYGVCPCRIVLSLMITLNVLFLGMFACMCVCAPCACLVPSQDKREH